MTATARIAMRAGDESAAVLLLEKLQYHCALSPDDQATLVSHVTPVRHHGSRQDLIREGERTEGVHILVSGFACRHRTLPDGRRQILGFSLPGDLCDAGALVTEELLYTVSTLAPSEVSLLPREALGDICGEFNSLARALWFSTLLDEAIAREWLFNIGQRTALERIAHLFCEIFERMRSVGRVHGDRCDFPVTQSELADTVALSTVHVNRTLQELRREGLLSVNAKTLVIHDLPRLHHLAMFDPTYLQLTLAHR